MRKVIPIAVEQPKPAKTIDTTSNAIQHMSVAGLEKDLVHRPTVRGRLDTGTFCNYDCEFCYYRDKLDVKTPWDIVKERIDYILQYGMTEIELSGGESSISPDWFRILDYCNERFTSISCLTHGGKFADIEYLRESRDRGLKEVMFSLHGSTAEVHDSITGRKGSFDRIIRGIRNAKELGMFVRTNTTVYYKNYHLLETVHADLLNDLQPDISNFLTLNYWGDYNVIDFKNVDYKSMTDAIKKCIDRLDPNIEINVRYTPFCYMKGYEKYVAGVFQHIYDIRDWNRELFTETLDVSVPYTDEQKIQNAYDACETHRHHFYAKPLTCMTCKHFYICDGIEKEISSHTPVMPEPGEKIKQVNHYRTKTVLR